MKSLGEVNGQAGLIVIYDKNTGQLVYSVTASIAVRWHLFDQSLDDAILDAALHWARANGHGALADNSEPTDFKIEVDPRDQTVRFVVTLYPETEEE